MSESSVATITFAPSTRRMSFRRRSASMKSRRSTRPCSRTRVLGTIPGLTRAARSPARPTISPVTPST